jgi:hypothetical protein
VEPWHQALLIFGSIRFCSGLDLVDGTEADGSGGGLFRNPPPLHVIGVPQQVHELSFPSKSPSDGELYGDGGDLQSLRQPLIPWF